MYNTIEYDSVDDAYIHSVSGWLVFFKRFVHPIWLRDVISQTHLFLTIALSILDANEDSDKDSDEDSDEDSDKESDNEEEEEVKEEAKEEEKKIIEEYVSVFPPNEDLIQEPPPSSVPVVHAVPLSRKISSVVSGFFSSKKNKEKKEPE
jgi:hypothetical protein